MKKNWGKPIVQVQQFVPQEYCANCGVYINGLHCEVYDKYGDQHTDPKTGEKYGTWSEDNGLWHSSTGGCTTWIDENGNSREEAGGTYQNDLTFVQGGPTSGQSTSDFLKSLGNGIHTDIVVKWTTTRVQRPDGSLYPITNSYIHKGYLEVNGNHS